MKSQKGAVVAEETWTDRQLSWGRGALKSEPAGLPAAGAAVLYQPYRKTRRGLVKKEGQKVGGSGFALLGQLLKCNAGCNDLILKSLGSMCVSVAESIWGMGVGSPSLEAEVRF